METDFLVTCLIPNIKEIFPCTYKFDDRPMSSPLAPEPVLRAALRVLHVAAYTTRNWTLAEEISRKQINALWEAIHEIPDLIKRWRGDAESLRELRTYLKEYHQRWDSPKLEQILDQALHGPSL